MKQIIFSSFLFLCSLSSGCVYANVRAPLDLDVNKTELGKRRGEASSHSILWLVAWGDSGTAAAADNGNIKIINHLDVEYTMVLFGLYMRISTIAYGD